MLQFDQSCPRAATAGIIGVDEVGRGCLAGPVTAGAVYLPPGFLFASAPLHPPLDRANDSKKLSPTLRAAIHDALVSLRDAAAPRPDFAVAHASVAEIRERDILGATCLAMERAITALFTRMGSPLSSLPDLPLFQQGQGPTSPHPVILVDGIPLRRLPIPHEAVVQGDTRSLAIALASICAKHQRDQLMIALDRTDPRYGYARHKGYGTAAHRAAIQLHGKSADHRWE